MTDRLQHVALILNVNKPYDRKVVAGVSRYMKEVGNWSLYLEDDPLNKIPDLDKWEGDGIIADLDDANVFKAVSNLKIPVVGFGGGYGPYQGREDIPYVFTDNFLISKLAADHLIDKGFRRFAFCGLPENSINGWSRERETDFSNLVREAGYGCEIFRGDSLETADWRTVQAGLQNWLKTLEYPLGMFVTNDSRARHVLEACRSLGIKVPEDAAIVGVDNDAMMCELADPPLTSVIQGTDNLGYLSFPRAADGLNPQRGFPLKRGRGIPGDNHVTISDPSVGP